MQKNFKRLLNCATALAGVQALLVSYVANAQVVATENPQANEDPAVDRQAPANEIIVTAQRREQAVVDVPIAITSISGDTLDRSGLEAITDISMLTPGLYLSRGGSFVQPVIRGIGTSVTSLGADANVAVYVDGVYRPSQTGNAFSLVDVERIDVLKGPQGTLFGRNATGGAILVTTQRPSLTGVEGQFSASYGRFDEVGLKGFVTAPISSSIGFSISSIYKDDNGYTRDVLLNEDVSTHSEFMVRPKLLFMLGDNTELFVTGYYSETSDTTGYSLDIFEGNTTFPAAPFFPDPSEIAQSFVPRNDVESRGADATITHDFGAVKLTSISAYSKVKTDILSDLDGTTANGGDVGFLTNQETFTQEINLASSSTGRFRWVLGGFYYTDKGEEPQFVFNGSNLLEATIDTDALAAFGEVEYEALDNLFLIAGIRYSTEKRDFRQVRSNGVVNADSERWSDWAPRVSVRYALNDWSNIYATYSSGFKSGTYNITANSSTPVNPENVEAFELGYKNSGSRISFGTSAFYYNYKDLQVQALNSVTGLTQLTNAGVAEIYGFDIDASANWENFILQTGFAYTHATYDDFQNAQVNLPNPNGLGNIAVSPFDATGNFLDRAPEFTANASATYFAPVGGGELAATLAGRYSSEFFFEAANRIRQDAHLLLNGQLSWTPASESFRVSVWGQNLTDVRYAQYKPDTTRGDRIAYARPLTYGISLDVFFGK